MPCSLLVLILLYFLPVTDAYTTFEQNCTLPSGADKINYISSPNTRGTLDILWSCLFTIIACTWTVQCPDVPTQRYQFKDGFIGWCTWAAKKYSSLAGWFLITMLAPEMLIGIYAAQAVRWDDYTKAFEKSAYANIDGVKWTKTHSSFAEMGGFVMKISKSPNYDGRPLMTMEVADVTTHDTSPQSTGMTYSLGAEYWKLDCRRILALRKTGIIKCLPNISTEEIEDRSKADNLLRLITVIQILWICIQTIARYVGDLAVSQLEISTVAFAICAICMYFTCWKKPKGVDVPITIFYYSGDAQGLQNLLMRAEEEVTQSVSGAEMEWRSELYLPHWTGTLKTLEVRVLLSRSQTSAWVTAVVLSSVAFGGIHLIAWNFTFPTHIEMILWRISALLCTCYIPASVLAQYLGRRLFEGAGISSRTKILYDFGSVLVNFGGLLYVLARLFIIVEMFRTLAFLPVEAYVGTWTVNIPYVS